MAETPAYLRAAASAMGLHEGAQNAALRDYLSNGGQNLDPATTAWCAAFVNASLAQGGMKGTGRLNARSYLDWGEEVETPQRGDVAVFSRGDPNGWKGHVGFFEGYDDQGNILVLGGNQNDRVSVAPYSADRLLGFRRASDGTGAPAPANALAAPSGPGMAPPGSSAPPMGNALAGFALSPDPAARQNALAQMGAMAQPRATSRLDPEAFMSRRRFG